VNDGGGGEKSAREIKQSQGVRDAWKFHRPQINPCSNVANYPAGAAFFTSAYKIYADYPAKRYKSNIFFRDGLLACAIVALLSASSGYIASR